MTRQELTPDTIRLLTLSTEPWLSCEDCFELMDEYVESVLTDPNTSAMPEMPIHLSGCAACAEEAESLLALVAQEDGIDPAGR
jgi:hypothetical protein